MAFKATHKPADTSPIGDEEVSAADKHRQLIADIEEGVVSGFVATYTHKEAVPIDEQAGGGTLGQHIDKMISEAMRAGARISAFNINVTEADWNKWM